MLFSWFAFIGGATARAQNILNRYAAITDICGTILILKEQPGFSVGDSVLMIQMQGATIKTGIQSTSFGDIMHYGSAGRYQFNRIAKIENKKIWLAYTPRQDFDIAGNIQLIDVPYLGNPTIGNLGCLPWDGSKGGVLVFAAGTLTLSGDIDVSGRGFRGGVVFLGGSSGQGNILDYFLEEDDWDLAGQKGESIHILQSSYTRAAGKVANGGGGGNVHNSGGGGGGNAGKGGDGGYYTSRPGLGGLGGEKLGFLEGRVFMGGGGGAGQDNNSHGASGANGGGIIIILASEINCNGHKIKANGDNAPPPGVVNGDSENDHDGGGGGGGGGSVLIQLAHGQSSNLNIEAKGGEGTTMRRNHGSGGGGGGGLIRISKRPNVLIWDVSGGFAGDNTSPNNNKATNGALGFRFIDASFSVPQATSSEPPLFFSQRFPIAECDGSATIKTEVKGGRGTISYRLVANGQTLLTNATGDFSGLKAGNYTVVAEDDCAVVQTNIVAVTYPSLSVGQFKAQPLRCDSLGSLLAVINGGKPQLRYQINAQGWQSSGLFEHLYPGDYLFEVEDARKCMLKQAFSIADSSAPLGVTILPDIPVIDMLKGDTLVLSAQTDASYKVLAKYAWDFGFGLSSRTDSTPVYRLNESQALQLTMRDQYGCEGTDEVYVRVRQDTIYLPNVLQVPSTNAENGLFVPQMGGGSAKILDFYVYNRWGNIVFQRKDFEAGDTAFAWDGTRNGTLLNPGVYVYFVRVQFRDGRVLLYRGDVALIR